MQTTDYSIFRNIDGNRQVHQGHVDRLVEAIERQNLLPYFPVLLNENMEVIDGQHRLVAAARLGLPVHYEIVDGLRLQDVMSINTHSKGWSMTDFIDSYIELGYKDYEVLKDFTKRTGIGASLGAGLLMGWSSLGGSGGSNGGGATSRSVKEGRFHVGSYERADRIANQAIELSKYADFETRRDRRLITALLQLNNNKDFDFERLRAKIRLHNLRLERRPTSKYYLLHIEELYNWKSSTGKVELYASSSKGK